MQRPRGTATRTVQTRNQIEKAERKQAVLRRVETEQHHASGDRERKRHGAPNRARIGRHRQFGRHAVRMEMIGGCRTIHVTIGALIERRF
jgi:hypothetical protein